jgi:hypothetical protein
MKQLYIFTSIFLLAFTVHAQGIRPEGGVSTGMAGASVTGRNLWGAFNNQAGLAYVRHISAGLIYENSFAIKELGTKAGAVAVPVNKGTFGLSFYQFGYNLYNENKIGLAYAMPLSDNFSAAVQLDYMLTQLAENYGRKGVVTFEAGLMAKLSDKWYMGAHIFNPVRVKLTEYVEERVPSYIRFGTNYIFSDKVNVVAEAEKDINHKPVVRLGVDYEIMKNIFIRAGVGTQPSIFAFGFGMNLKNFTLDIATSKHTALGYSPGVSLMYTFK